MMDKEEFRKAVSAFFNEHKNMTKEQWAYTDTPQGRSEVLIVMGVSGRDMLQLIRAAREKYE